MKRHKKRSSTEEVDKIETSYVLRFQQNWSVEKIARYFSVGRKTVYRWLALYGDTESRYWKETRFKRARKATYGDEVESLIKQLKEEVPERSASTIHELLEEKLGPACPSVETIRRSLRKMGYSKGKPRDRKGYVKFEREFPNDLWQVDFKGWEYFDNLGKVHLLTIIDDCSRYVLAARWYASDEEAHVISLLREAIEMHGLPNDIMSDNGSQFRGIQDGQQTRYQRLMAMFGVTVIFHQPDHPQSKGKVERWFGTAASAFLPEAHHLFAMKPSTTLSELNGAFEAWLNRYNTKHKHRSLARKTPADVYFNHPRRLSKPLTVPIDWDSWIVRPVTRKVSKQNIVDLEGHKLQLPPGHAGVRVQIRRYEDRYDVFNGDTLVDTFFKASMKDGKANGAERKVSDAGTFKYKRRAYYVGYKNAGKIVRIQEAINGKDLLVYNGDELIARIPIDNGSAY